MQIRNYLSIFILGMISLACPEPSRAALEYQCVSYVLPLLLMAPDQAKTGQKKTEHVPFIKATSSKSTLLDKENISPPICKKTACFNGNVTYYALWIYDSQMKTTKHYYHGKCDSSEVSYNENLKESL